MGQRGGVAYTLSHSIGQDLVIGHGKPRKETGRRGVPDA